MIDTQTLQLMQPELGGISTRQVKTVLDLMDAGNTVPFIARYRKEMTGSLDEVQIQAIETSFNRVTALQERKQTVIKAISELHKLTPELKKTIQAATKLPEVEDLYLPYKQKRQTKATIAKAQGLEPFARWILTLPAGNLADEARNTLKKRCERCRCGVSWCY